MFSSVPLVYCRCVDWSMPRFPAVHPALWRLPVKLPAVCNCDTQPGGMTTHADSWQDDSSNLKPATTSKTLKFGIDNILYGTWQTDKAIQSHDSHSEKPANQRSIRSRVSSTYSSRPWCRPVFSRLQRRSLEKRFNVSKYVTKRERLQLGALLDLTETQVKVWFQNRRTKWRHRGSRQEESIKSKNVIEWEGQTETSSQKVEADENHN